MCQFNFILTEKVTERELLEPLLISNGLAYSELNNKHMMNQIDGLQKAISITHGHCDCGSILGIDQNPASHDLDLDRERKRLKKQKWTKSKIERYLADKLKNQIKKEENRELGNESEETRWMNLTCRQIRFILLE